MRSGPIGRWRSHATLLLLCVALAGCPTLPPSEALPAAAAGSAPATNAPVAQPPARNADAVEADEANHIYFARRSTQVDPAGQEKLRLHAARLKEHPKEVVYLAAYAENLGSASYELAIANQRIEAVARLLRSYGVATRQMHPLRRYGVARGRPAPTCATADCREKRGRVVLSFGMR